MMLMEKKIHLFSNQYSIVAIGVCMDDSSVVCHTDSEGFVSDHYTDFVH